MLLRWPRHCWLLQQHSERSHTPFCSVLARSRQYHGVGSAVPQACWIAHDFLGPSEVVPHAKQPGQRYEKQLEPCSAARGRPRAKADSLQLLTSDASPVPCGEVSGHLQFLVTTYTVAARLLAGRNGTRPIWNSWFLAACVCGSLSLSGAGPAMQSDLRALAGPLCRFQVPVERGNAPACTATLRWQGTRPVARAGAVAARACIVRYL